jgi:BNR repeat-like domain
MLARLPLGVAASAVTLAIGAQAATASDLGTGPLKQVSDTSPFESCKADDVGGQTGTVFPDSEVEPWIDVNPTDPDNIVGMWQADRWSNGGARGHVVGVSDDGGASWTQTTLPNVTVCSEEPGANFGHYQRTTDPWISFAPAGAPDGTLHQISLSFNDIAPPFGPEDEQPGGDFDHALLASKSTDGGLTWSDPEFVIRDLDANVFNDKQSITADPVSEGNVYAVWDRLAFPTSERASVISGFVTSAFRGPTWFARSTDNGDSWEEPRQIYDPGQNDQTIANQIVVLPNGTLVNGFAEFQNQNSNQLSGWNVRVQRSPDEGDTWSDPIQVSRLRSILITDPESGEDVRTGDIIPDFAVNPDNGKLYAVWQDARFSNLENDSIALSKSTDGGSTWSDPIKVNATPTDIPAGNQQAFTASVDVADDGTVAVTYYDFRHNTEAEELATDYWAVHCHSACGQAQNWGSEDRLTDTPFDMRQAPLTSTGFFTGDYEGLANAGDDFTPFFSQTHGDDPSSVFFRRLGP